MAKDSDPAGHGWHAAPLDWPSDSPYVPRGQSVQLASSVAPGRALYVPAGQRLRHDEVRPARDEYVPGEHSTHEPRPGTVLNFPGGQSVQAVAPGRLYLPAGQARQLLTILVVPITRQSFPDGVAEKYVLVSVVGSLESQIPPCWLLNVPAEQGRHEAAPPSMKRPLLAPT